MWSLKYTIVYDNISVLGYETGDWEEVASKATCFWFFKCCYSLCRAVPAVFLTIPQKCVSCTETVRVSDKHQVKKLCSLLLVSAYTQHTHSSVWCWNASFNISMKEQGHSHGFPLRSVWRYLKSWVPSHIYCCGNWRRAFGLPAPGNSVFFLSRSSLRARTGWRCLCWKWTCTP